MRGHIAATFGFEHLGHDLQAIGAVGEALQVEVEHGLAVVVDAGFGQVFAAGVFQGVIEAEAVIRVTVERRQRRAQGHFCADTATCRRRAEQVHGSDFGHHLVRCNPAQHRRVMQAQADFHTVRLEVADLEADAAQVGAGMLLTNQLQGCGVVPGGGHFAAGEIKGFKTAGGQLQRLANHLEATRIGDLQLHRQALQGAFPVAAAHDHAQVRGLAGAVQAAVGEQVGAEAINRTVFFQTAYVEAR